MYSWNCNFCCCYFFYLLLLFFVLYFCSNLFDFTSSDWTSSTSLTPVGFSHPIGYPWSELSDIILLSIDDRLKVVFLFFQLSQPFVHSGRFFSEFFDGEMVDVEWLSPFGESLSFLFSVGLSPVVSVSVSVHVATGRGHGSNCGLLPFFFFDLFGFLFCFPSEFFLLFSFESFFSRSCRTRICSARSSFRFSIRPSSSWSSASSFCRVSKCLLISSWSSWRSFSIRCFWSASKSAMVVFCGGSCYWSTTTY